MKLSVCCMTKDPPARVAASLRLLRDVADEVVVAVDSRVALSTMGPLTRVADRIFRFDQRPPVDRPRPWLASQCTGDWLLWLDGDELPSPAFVRSLPCLLTARDVVQYHLPRRWLFPDPDHWLKETPWWPDHQIRLLRNDPATMRYGNTHEPIVPTLPWRCLETPLYHLSCLVGSLAARRDKVRAYDAERPGLVSPAGGSFNAVLQVPEQSATRRPVPVPHEDRDWIGQVLATEVAESPDDEPNAAPLVPAEEIDAHSPLRSLAADDYRAEIEVLEPDTRFAPGVERYVLIRIQNLGRAFWPWGWHHPPIRVSYHWWRPDGDLVTFEGKRTLLPTTVRPGESVLVTAGVVPPAAPGRYVLEFDLIHEGIRWFDCSTRFAAQVADRWQLV
jgi:hypothetical protein